MVYPPEDGHPSQYQPGPTCVNFVHATNAANHYATPPTNGILTAAGAACRAAPAWSRQVVYTHHDDTPGGSTECVRVCACVCVCGILTAVGAACRAAPAWSRQVVYTHPAGRTARCPGTSPRSVESAGSRAASAPPSSSTP